MFSGEILLPGRRIAVLLAALVVCLSAPPASGEVKPGDFVDANNAARVKEFLPPGVYWRVLHGMTMKIVPTAWRDGGSFGAI